VSETVNIVKYPCSKIGPVEVCGCIDRFEIRLTTLLGVQINSVDYDDVEDLIRTMADVAIEGIDATLEALQQYLLTEKKPEERQRLMDRMRQLQAIRSNLVNLGLVPE